MKSKKKSKAKEEEAAIQAAMQAAQAAAAAGVTVRIHSVNETAGRQTVECPQVELGGQRPVGLHGGALLGIAVAKHLKSGDPCPQIGINEFLFECQHCRRQHSEGGEQGAGAG